MTGALGVVGPAQDVRGDGDIFLLFRLFPRYVCVVRVQGAYSIMQVLLWVQIPEQCKDRNRTGCTAITAVLIPERGQSEEARH
jgi:hypothetical protein